MIKFGAAMLLLGIVSIGLGVVEAPETNESSADDTQWMREARFGVFMHYQYRILLGYSVATHPSFPKPSEMSAAQWNQFVDGFDAKGFARQMAEAKVGWVIFCLDDHYFAWPCAPNKIFCDFTGYGPGEKCSRRDLIMDLADALGARHIKLIVYFAGLNGYMKEPQVSPGFLNLEPGRGSLNEKLPPSQDERKRRLGVLKEYADRYGEKIAGWWFDGMELNTYANEPNGWESIASIVRKPNPHAVIAFSYGHNEHAGVHPGVDDFTGGDTWSKQDLVHLTPRNLPAQNGILWHGKIYCGNIYHGQGTSNQYSDEELIQWIKTCNSEGGVCTLDWPFDPKTGLLKEFGFEQLKRVSQAIRTEDGK